MTKSLKIGLLLLFLFQVFISFQFELAHDEAYYWLYSKYLDWGYFDHPPFVGVVIKLFSFLPHSEFSVRIGFIVLQFLTLGLILSLVPKKNHLIACLMFFSYPLASFTGLLALPDMPLLFMTACYFWMLNRYLNHDDKYSVLGMSLTIPLLLYAKYHGILLIFFTLVSLPSLLKRKSFYLITILSILFFLPHVWWQYQHNFSTLRYHFIERPSSSFSIKRSLEYVGIQVLLSGIFAGPIIWYVVLKEKTETQFSRVLKVSAIGIIVFFFVSSFSKKVEANWTISTTIPLILLTAGASIWDTKRFLQKIVWLSFTIVILARLLWVIPPERVSLKRLKEFHGWKVWSQQVLERCGSRIPLANTYQIASKLSFYLNQDVGSLNFHSRKNQFDNWRFQDKYLSQDVCYLTDKQEFQGETIQTPEGKDLKVILDKALTQLMP